MTQEPVQQTVADDQPLLLRLYVSGSAPNSVRAIDNARAICEEHFAAAHILEIIDLAHEPHRAADDAIVVTPTLLKISPAPEQRVVGNLSDAGHVLSILAGR